MMTSSRRASLSVVAVLLTLSLVATWPAAGSPERPNESDALTDLPDGAPLHTCQTVQDDVASAADVPSCIPAAIPGTLGSGSAVYPGTSGTTPNRLFRDGVASTCASPKATPPIYSAEGSFRYDAYAFTHYGAPACVTVELSAPAGSCYVHGQTYLGSFNPANVQANYLADSGKSATPGEAPIQYSFMVETNDRFVVVVNEPFQGGPANCPYTIKVTGTTGCPQVWGHVFLDQNGNGVRDTAEKEGISDVRITLTPYAGGSVWTIRNDGYYQFVSVPPGDYCAAAAIPHGYRSTSPANVCFTVNRNMIVNFGVQRIARYLTFMPLVRKQ